MSKGKILSINADKGFGFIKPVGGGADVFFHCSAVDAEFSTLQVEQAVEFEMDPQAEKPRACKVLTGTKNPRQTASTYEGATPHRGKKLSAERPNGANRYGGNRSGGYQGKIQGNGSNSYARTPRPPRQMSDHVFGYVTKLPRKNPIGFISSVDGGPEYYFEPGDVLGNTKFERLLVGDYVRFIAKPNPEDPKQPLAKAVEVVPKPINKQENNLARHPKARRKKPTWK